MNKKELRKISLQYRTLASQMLKVDSQEEINLIKMFFDFITDTAFIYDYIKECNHVTYDFKTLFEEKTWNDKLELPSSQKDLIDYGYQLLNYILDGSKQLFTLGQGYTSSNKFREMISAFMRKVVEPFVVALRSYLELSLIDCDNEDRVQTDTVKTVFLSYCQKDSDIANLIETELGSRITDKARISRDIRDVEYHESFKKFMQSIEKHDFVITIISDRYIKSRNCMYEVLEVVRDRNFRNKLIYIVLNEEDKKYYKAECPDIVGADVYSTAGLTKYSLFWKQKLEELQEQIDSLGDPTYAITQIKEKKIVQKILLDIPEFMEFVKDSKGVSLSEHIKKHFTDVISFMGL
ncbi:hypothetical protein acsn021_11710 [Anaerocolumna cellulosilytica]|uniref:Uncharacterized protein n=1 Tax=Anaerocolumna cellulosilytica TaxID=433286 RepID=A0A6S6R276_9FIRM|nr:toll/interleukin-1 receptor domain-containing protein [Anaerocolumna cellulosilytica]MBB5196094.1 hypothetical protein [Anaerocolumna cellulosilytica]BCJ93602.1 hypothetical protein acsn021_11710 [Anaerocolumna cellulosilytica]